MPDPDLRLTFDRGAIAALAGDIELRDHTLRVAEMVADHAGTLARKGTGAGAESFAAWPGQDSRGVFADVSWDQDHFYMIFAEFGTSTRPDYPALGPAVDRYLHLK